MVKFLIMANNVRYIATSGDEKYEIEVYSYLYINGYKFTLPAMPTHDSSLSVICLQSRISVWDIVLTSSIKIMMVLSLSI